MRDTYYADDFVKLYHGDCREVTEWLAADVLVTDPPYGIAWESGRTSHARTPLVESVVGDHDVSVRDAVISLWGSAPAVIFGSWRQPRPQHTRHRLIWHKRGALPGMTSAPFYPVDEEIYVLGSGWAGPPTPTVVVTHEARSGAVGLVARIGHPTPKPVHLMEWLILKCGREWVIADPFAGSGSTLVAARNQGRKAIGVEVEERYCEIAAKRLAQDVLDFGSVA